MSPFRISRAAGRLSARSCGQRRKKFRFNLREIDLNVQSRSHRRRRRLGNRVGAVDDADGGHDDDDESDAVARTKLIVARPRRPHSRLGMSSTPHTRRPPVNGHLLLLLLLCERKKEREHFSDPAIESAQSARTGARLGVDSSSSSRRLALAVASRRLPYLAGGSPGEAARLEEEPQPVFEPPFRPRSSSSF